MEYVWVVVIILAIVSWVLRRFVMPVAEVVQTVSNNNFIKTYISNNDLFDASHYITTVTINGQKAIANVLIAYNGIHFPLRDGDSFVIPRDKIQYFVKEGDVSYTNQVYSNGRGLSLGKAVVGGLIAGPLGAVIGGVNGSERIENTTVVHDNTETYIYYFINENNVSIISVNGLQFYQMLKMKFNEKEYNYVITQQKIFKEHEEVAKCNDIEIFGKYPQSDITGKKSDDIEWYVLSRRKGKKLLFSKYILDCIPFQNFNNEIIYTIPWKDSDLREWLNSTFVEKAFNDSEKEMIICTDIDDVRDKVFCLSEEEYFDLFGINNDTVEPFKSIAGTKGTEYAKNVNNCALQIDKYDTDESKWADGNSFYWLRSQTYHGIMGENTRGGISSAAGNSLLLVGGACATDDSIGVRPAIWVTDVKIENNTKTDIENKPDLILKYKKLLDDGIITQEEFEGQKRKILN